MNETEKTLLQLVGRALFGARTGFDPASVSWAEVYEECGSQALTLLVWDALTEEERACLPGELSRRWEQDAMRHIISNEQLAYEQRQVIETLTGAGIPCVILKGTSSALCYPNPALRAMGDIDLLVSPAQQREAVRLLQRQGYGDALDENHHCHLTIVKDGIDVEVHREVNGLLLVDDAASLRKFRDFFADALERRQTADGLPMLADDQQAVSLLLHKLEHFLLSGLGLRQLCDWAVFVEKKLDAALWQRLQPMLAEVGILYFTGVITRVCVDYLGLPERYAPWAMEYDGGLAREVMEQLLREGNFGRKTDKYGERLFSNPGASNRVTSFFKVLLSVCRTHWPVCERHPLLLPIAPFAVLGQYLANRRQGKRPKLNLLQKYRQSGADRELYKQLRPFIPEK